VPFRLPAPPVPPGAGPVAGPGPVVLFLPAHDEAATVAAVVGRVPALVRGRRVQCLVVDDGSGDRTAELAAGAGAVVVGTGAATNRGLGAAVRAGLAEAVRRGAAAVAFCDADGEYDPDELDRLVAPILEGRADYVVGSRFAGDIRRMLPHRRLGNRLLTRLLGWVARAPISDGQSGYRALSRAAAADAEVVHDYNYAQVLTLDLLAKGYRYLEVPIGYRWRTAGRSFVRPAAYLRRVAPAVWRELNRSGPPPEVAASPAARMTMEPGRVLQRGGGA
jgi:glycosyltransferase involved in cell wall biosynthesis